MNPNSNAATTQAMVAIALQILPGVEGWTAPRGPGMIVTEEALAASAEEVAAADLPDAAGVIVAAFGDPGQAALAARLDCPVVGIGAAAAAEAGMGGRRFAVVTTTPGLERSVDGLMRAHAGAGRYVGCFLTQGDPLRLMEDADALDRALMAGIDRAAGQGAAVAIIGGGPLGEAAERLADHAAIPLIAPIRAAARALKDRL
ncbi:Asp/Glu racemase [Sagittula stellata E-37]|uniref:Asp/Glu racemase n=2 Tax=Sagittula stellata TaxID=52603 RepID=A3JYM9_SAGS3|nr:Asp/Glu racemase [Sagittula stellata E-37]